MVHSFYQHIYIYDIYIYEKTKISKIHPKKKKTNSFIHTYIILYISMDIGYPTNEKYKGIDIITYLYPSSPQEQEGGQGGVWT